MASTCVSYGAIFVTLAMAGTLCIAAGAAAGTAGGGTEDVDADTARRERAAATVAELLAVHNEARRAVGVEPLSWSAGIAWYAKKYAQSRRGDCAPRRSPLFYFGENLFVGKGRHWNATALAAAWVDEGRWYDYAGNTCGGAPAAAGGGGCARYTQVVWRNTTQLGCGRVACNSGDTLLVCDYFPPGNYGTGRPY